MAHPKMVISAPRNHNVTKRMERHEQALCAGSRTLTLDLVNEHMITVGEMQEAGMNMQQVCPMPWPRAKLDARSCRF